MWFQRALFETKNGMRSQSVQGLKRLLIKFPTVFVPAVKVFEASGENDRTNLSMGFAMYDSRVGPSVEEKQILQNLDATAMFQPISIPWDGN